MDLGRLGLGRGRRLGRGVGTKVGSVRVRVGRHVYLFLFVEGLGKRGERRRIG